MTNEPLPRLVAFMSGDGPCIGYEDDQTLVAEVFGSDKAERLVSSWNICAKYGQVYLSHLENREAAVLPMHWLRQRNAAHKAMLADLTEAAATLRRYETYHRAKATADSIEKAEVNATLAARFEATIANATASGDAP